MCKVLTLIHRLFFVWILSIVLNLGGGGGGGGGGDACLFKNLRLMRSCSFMHHLNKTLD